MAITYDINRRKAEQILKLLERITGNNWELNFEAFVCTDSEQELTFVREPLSEDGVVDLEEWKEIFGEQIEHILEAVRLAHSRPPYYKNDWQVAAGPDLKKIVLLLSCLGLGVNIYDGSLASGDTVIIDPEDNNWGGQLCRRCQIFDKLGGRQNLLSASGLLLHRRYSGLYKLAAQLYILLPPIIKLSEGSLVDDDSNVESA